ncbi:anti-sigma factor [Paenibacillus psychroresistens]|uniref:Anti-sigma-W factor RsiW n=1 Tax=Paenibacillus psychroresistens TaxID=1778678 RepID=A0A6B8RS31_9BACL|nr:anti-sigma factor [Paenibacillus psychroresistens]
MNCNEALPWMHEYLDGDLTGTPLTELKKHLLSCQACSLRYRKMQNTEAMVRSLPHLAAPADLTDRIMASLPKQPKRSNAWLQWIKRHPAISVASMFIFVMLSASLSMWNSDTELVVKGASLEQVVIKGDTVYVPAGHTVNGNLMVKNGKIQIDGQVNGNLVVIDGTYNLASTAHISGKIKQVDQALDWLWFEVNEYVGLFAK